MELTLFGGFKLLDDNGSTLELRARKSKALLAWLALHQNKQQSRDRLASLLWEEADETQARHSLRQALSGLRKSLGEHAQALVTDQESLTLLGGHIEVDLLRFDNLLEGDPDNEALTQAIALYGGDFLEGFNPRSNSYEEWLMTQRSHYREHAVSAMRRLLQHYAQTDQPEAGIRLAIQLLGNDPLQEQVHRTLMSLYARLGRPAEALRQYRQCRRILFRELGVSPDPETQQLWREIAQGREKQEPDEKRSAGEEMLSVNPPGDTRDLKRNEDQPSGSTQLRPVTLLHLHLGVYREASGGKDPEKLHLLTKALRHQAERLAKDHGGELYSQQGDSLTILFGLKKAQGNEGEKALQLALILIADKTNPEISQLVTELSICCAIACGKVVCEGTEQVSGPLFAEAEQLARGGDSSNILISDRVYLGLRRPPAATRYRDSAWLVNDLHPSAARNQAPIPLVGRRRQLRQLDASLHACVEDGAGESFLIRGEAGIGKSRLVEEIGKRAKRQGMSGHAVLVLDFGMETRAGPIPDLLRQLLGLPEQATAEEIGLTAKECMGGRWDDTLHQPAMHALFRLPVEAEQSQPSEELTHMGSRALIGAILERACQSLPRLLIVEDIHWADGQTLLLLAEIANAVARQPALLIITSRVEGEPLDPAWRSAMHGAPLTTLDLQPLKEDQARQLAEQLSVTDGQFLDDCIRRAGGNPFFLEQLLLGGSDQGGSIPDSVQSLVLNRLDMLEQRDREAAQAASVLGQRFYLEPLREVMKDQGYRPDMLLSQRLLRPEGNGYLFSHALLRDGIYASLLTTERCAHHLGAAEWYRQRDPALYARHLDLAGDQSAAGAYLEAARQAISTFDFEQALELVSRGCEIVRETSLGAQLNSLRGELLIQAGDIGKAVSAYREAAEATDDLQIRCRALIGEASALTIKDDLNRALELLQEATPLAGDSEDANLLTELNYRRGDILFALGRTDECLEAHRQAERLARASKAPLLEIRALAGMADAYYANGRMQTAEGYFERCLTLAKREKRLPQELGNLSMLGLTRFYLGSVADAIAEQWETTKLAATYGNLRAEMSAQLNLGLICLYTEEIETAEQAARRSLELARQLGATRFYGDNLAAIGEALVLKGKIEEGIEYLERAYRAAMDSVPTHTAPFILGVLARVVPDQKRRQQAIEEGHQILEQGGLSHNYLHFYQNLIEMYLQNGNADEALRYVAALEEYTAAEPLGWSDFYIERGRLLADVIINGSDDAARLQADRLLQRASGMGLYFGTPELIMLRDG